VQQLFFDCSSVDSIAGQRLLNKISHLLLFVNGRYSIVGMTGFEPVTTRPQEIFSIIYLIILASIDYSFLLIIKKLVLLSFIYFDFMCSKCVPLNNIIQVEINP